MPEPRPLRPGSARGRARRPPARRAPGAPPPPRGPGSVTRLEPRRPLPAGRVPGRRPPARRNLVLSVAAGVLALAAVTALAGWLVGGLATRDSEPAPPPDLRAARVGPLGLEVSGEWKPVRGGRELEGFDRDSALAFEPLPGLSVRAVVALTPAAHTTLVPQPLRARLSDPLPEAVQSRVAGAPAWTYRMSGNERRDGLLEITVVPTTAGVLSVACIGSGTSWTAGSVCGAGIRRLHLARERVLHPAADLAFRERLAGVMERLDERRVPLRRALRRARTGRAQSAAAGGLARAYRRAAARLAPYATPTGPTAELAGALRRTAPAYGALATAARRGRPQGYARARRAVRAGEARVTRGLARFADPNASG